VRIFDLAGALCGLIVLSPLLLLISILIKLDSPGPVFYCPARVGRYGRQFRLYKFRTMVRHADRSGPGITIAEDSRITTIGKMLRRTKADEFPQFVNVLKGEMSLVGPRPEDPGYVARYSAEQRRVLTRRPGMTSAASLRYRHEEKMLAGPNWEQHYVEQIMADKIAIELEYMERRSLWTDLRLILLTFAAFFFDYLSEDMSTDG
jgi:lipopolysaccharide/colanic/teichoic acid biosynthesis glycosyltransferase